MKKQLCTSLYVVGLAASISACGNSQRLPAGPTPMVDSGASTAQYMMPEPMYSQQPAAVYEAPVQPNTMMPMQQPQADVASLGELSSLKERVLRVERAMIRLDKRMQLLERNELSRISRGQMEGQGTAPVTGGFQPMSYDASDAGMATSVQRLGLMPQQGTGSLPVQPAVAPQLPNGNSAYPQTNPYNGSGLQPVSYQAQSGDMIVSSLQAAPAQVNRTAAAQGSRLTPRLPSLADEAKSSADNAAVAIWAVEYETGKVWPNRDQLSTSRDVIEALRNGEKFAVYARGLKPSSSEFRERVRAVSKYLAKVSDVDTVPIASMPAKHLGTDTIEFMVVR